MRHTLYLLIAGRNHRNEIHQIVAGPVGEVKFENSSQVMPFKPRTFTQSKGVFSHVALREKYRTAKILLQSKKYHPTWFYFQPDLFVQFSDKAFDVCFWPLILPEADFRSQDIEAHLLRPKPYLALRVGEAFGALLARMAVLGITAGLLLQFADAGRPPAEVYGYLLFLGPLAGLIAILQFALVGMCGFWMRRVQPAFLLVQKSSFLLGGLVAPITLYPEWLRKICEATPFAAQLYMPAILTVHASKTAVLSAFGIQLFWIAALGGFAGMLWRVGLAAVVQRGA